MPAKLMVQGHTSDECENAGRMQFQPVAEASPEDAWAKLQQAVEQREVDDAKEAIQEYVRSLNGSVTYRELQEAMLDQGIKLWFIAMDRPLIKPFTNMDLQGKMGKRYSISYRFSEKPDRPREAAAFPKNREELLARLEDAGEVVSSGQSLCRNCNQMGHTAKRCTQERAVRVEQPKISCGNCGQDGHRLRDCMSPGLDTRHKLGKGG